MPVTLKDIAEKTGVSPSVVSTVLSGRENGTFVSQETRERVQQTAQRLSYTPVRAGRPRGSRRLRQQRVEQFIGVWCQSLDTSGIVHLNALQKALDRHASVNSFVPGHEFEFGIRILTEADLPRLDMLGLMGLVILGNRLMPRTAAAATIPTVLLGEVEDAPRDMVTIHMDNFAAARSLGEHLWKLGHRRFAFIAPSDKARSGVTRQRWQGLQAAWVDHGGSVDWGTPGPYDAFRNLSVPMQIHKTISGLVDVAEITAYVCMNETVASYALQALSQHGVMVPTDLSVVAFGDSPNGAEALTPPLTTVRLPAEQMATMAIAQLYSMREKGDAEPPFVIDENRRSIAYPGELIVRASSGHVKAG
jgi:LacI family repressor for deo operon, udp, cdd, tsx, nupC, and nupG